MNLIEINALDNGAHENRSTPWETTVPEGWAVIPDGLPLPESFPFVDLETALVDGVPTVTAMTKREMPAQKAPAEAAAPTMEQQVEALKTENAALTERISAQEEALTDLQLALCSLYEQTADGGETA